jgi:hypothetical protein
MSSFLDRWVVPSALYASATLLVLLSILLVWTRVGAGVGCYWGCEIGGLIVVLSVSTPVFGLLGLWPLRVERLQCPTPLDHLRHCVLLYAGLALLGLVLATSPDRWSLGWMVGAVLFVVGAYAASVDAVVLYALRWHSGRRDSPRP